MAAPDFMQKGGFNWTRSGYHLLFSADERARVQKPGPDADVWIELAHIAERAKVGDFSQVAQLPEFFRADAEQNFGPVALFLMGDMGNKQQLESLVDVMETGHEALTVYACEAARNAGCLWLVPHMVDAWRRAETLAGHEMIGFAISDLLEPVTYLDDMVPLGELAGYFTQNFEGREVGPRIADALPGIVNEGADDRFAALARELLEEARSSVSDPDQPVWGGRGITARGFAERFLALITSDQFTPFQGPLTVKYRHRFEAMTGIDCTSFYEDGRFRQINAVGVLEEYLDADEPAPEQRIFFGHQIR